MHFLLLDLLHACGKTRENVWKSSSTDTNNRRSDRMIRPIYLPTRAEEDVYMSIRPTLLPETALSPGDLPS
jgi:hypothetical protein